jgi:hypothetical protein
MVTVLTSARQNVQWTSLVQTKKNAVDRRRQVYKYRELRVRDEFPARGPRARGSVPRAPLSLRARVHRALALRLIGRGIQRRVSRRDIISCEGKPSAVSHRDGDGELGQSPLNSGLPHPGYPLQGRPSS